jgi:hypothetical protein
MSTITFDFEYDMPDEYLYQTADKGLTATWTYVGPEKIWITVDRLTGQLEYSSGWHADNGTDAQADFMHTLAGRGRKALLIDAREEPLIAAIFVDTTDQSTLPQKEYKLKGDDTVYYSRSEITTPEHTYEVADITYNLEINQWNTPFPWKKAHVTMEQLDIVRNSILVSVAADIANPETSTELKVQLEAYHVELGATVEKFAGWDAWQIPFPTDPRIQDVELPTGEESKVILTPDVEPDIEPDSEISPE